MGTLKKKKKKTVKNRNFRVDPIFWYCWTAEDARNDVKLTSNVFRQDF